MPYRQEEKHASDVVVQVEHTSPASGLSSTASSTESSLEAGDTAGDTQSTRPSASAHTASTDSGYLRVATSRGSPSTYISVSEVEGQGTGGYLDVCDPSLPYTSSGTDEATAGQDLGTKTLAPSEPLQRSRSWFGRQRSGSRGRKGKVAVQPSGAEDTTKVVNGDAVGATDSSPSPSRLTRSRSWFGKLRGSGRRRDNGEAVSQMS